MKGPQFLLAVLLVGGSTLGLGDRAWAQPVHPPGPVAAGDASGLAGYLGSKKSFAVYDDWDHSPYVGGSFGWYWTDHLKTEIEAGASARSEKYAFFSSTVGTRFINRQTTYHFSTRRLAVGQQYQFFRNAMFHPYVGVGLELTWEKTEQQDEAETIYDTATRQTVSTHVVTDHPDRTELVPRAAAAAGFKAYMSEKTFFRSDLKLTFASGVEEVLLRFGFGVDF